MKTLYVSLVSRPRKDWRDHIEPPKKAANWKQETFENKLEELWLKKEDGAADDLAAGEIVCTAVLPITGPIVQASNAQKFLASLPVMEGNEALRIIGFDIGRKLKQVAWDLIQDGKPAPLWLWSADDEPVPGLIAVDLYRLSGAKSAGIPIEGWLKEWGVEWAANDTDVQVAAVRKVADLMGLREPSED